MKDKDINKMEYLTIDKIELGSNDATEYRNNPNLKDFFNKKFFRDENLDNLLNNRIFYLIGEKGTGKTAYSVFLSNNTYKNNRASTVFLTQTDYSKFISFKQANLINYTNYTSLWELILLNLLSTKLIENFKKYNFAQYPSFWELQKILKKYVDNSESLEVSSFIENIVQNEAFIKAINEMVSIGVTDKEHKKIEQTNLTLKTSQLKKTFLDTLQKLALPESFILFIDGLDIQQTDMDHHEYMNCIEGLVNACWNLNDEHFQSNKFKKNNLKIIINIRPDIFQNLSIQNKNTKLQNNAVNINWSINNINTYKDSNLFKLTEKIICNDFQNEQCWDYYFPVKDWQRSNEKNAFSTFLSSSFFRPRDIITILGLIKKHGKQKKYFSFDDFRTIEKDYSDYLLGEIREHMSFYHQSIDFDDVIKFFDYVDGKTEFSMEFFKKSYQEYVEDNGILSEKYNTAKKFLDFLYQSNMVGYDELTQQFHKFQRWHYREVSTTKLLDSVHPRASNIRVHRGLIKSLKLGSTLI